MRADVLSLDDSNADMFRHPDFREITMRRTRAKARDYRGELTLS